MKKREMFQVDDDIDFCFDLWTVEWIKTHPKESVALSQTTSKEQNLLNSLPLVQEALQEE